MTFIHEVKEISEFRGIRRLSSPIPLRRFNILIGKNNAGKSTLMEAIFVGTVPEYGEPVTGNNVHDFIMSRHDNEARRLIYKYAGRAQITCETEKRTITHILRDGGDLLRRISSRRNEIVQRSKEPSTISPVVFLPYDIEFMKRINGFLEKREPEIVKKKIHTKTARRISKVLDEEFTEIVLKKDGWYFRRSDASYIHIEDAGDGVKKSVKVMMLLELLQPKLVLWDDFDAALHPGMLRELMKWLALGPWQVVLSTHSIDVLYYFDDLKEEIDGFDGQVIFLRKDSKDVLHHRELNPDEVETLLESNVDPRLIAAELDI
ncbi:MAG: AAA family ATPase [Thermococci archaeon]|nr:AAA family ATPase [Thermococci archaeon]